MKDKAYITGSVLKWSRETAKLSIDQVARTMKKDPASIAAWENEADYPTIKQAEKLSEMYKRALAVFFLPVPPKDFDTLKDFRGKNEQRDFSTALTFYIRELQQKQNWLIEQLESDREEELKFLGKFALNSKVIEIANDIKNEIGFDSLKNLKEPLRDLINKVEQKRIFVSLSSNFHSRSLLNTAEVRGFAICDKLAPFIFINTADSKNGQLFTLMHELAHLWLNSSGISNIDFRESLNSIYDPIEILCNEVAAEILMPIRLIREAFKGKNITIDLISNFSKEINVSSFALAVRLLKNNLIKNEFFYHIKSIFEKRYNEFLKKEESKEKTGTPSPFLLQVRKNSRAFSNYVYQNYKSGRINGAEASSLLKIKINNFSRMERYLFV
ncbi:MAG: XRE family transcriptional regulator [Candidatus Kapabacteria bacterium]|nr:XRE family transcriptional regulator [Candidatus Kapabacteria bacterium]